MSDSSMSQQQCDLIAPIGNPAQPVKHGLGLLATCAIQHV